MSFLEGLWIVSIVHFLAAVSPGPDFVLISQHTIKYGKKSGFFCCLGMIVGLLIHVTYSLFGLATVINSSTIILLTVKYLGAIYLVYLGITGITSKKINDESIKKEDFNSTNKIEVKQSVFAGFVCNLLNPKAPLYFISLFTIVLPPNLTWYQLLAYGVWIILIQIIWFLFVVYVLSIPKINMQFQKRGYLLERLLGIIMIFLGLKILSL